jgi:transposase-like protein
VTLELFLREVRDGIHYAPNLVVIDLDQTGREAAQSVFPYAPIQLCVVHFERIVDRTIPKLKRTTRQMELKQMVRDALYAQSENGARGALDGLLRRRGYFRDRKSRQVIGSLKENFEATTHFRVEGSFRSNNAGSVNDKLAMKLRLMRGYKSVRTARNSLKLTVMHYRFNPFSSCRIKEHNGKSPRTWQG